MLTPEQFFCQCTLFILEGIPAVLVGVYVWFGLPDYPETAKFLTEEEREFASRRMGPYAPKGTDKHFDWQDLKNTVLAWQFWAFAAQYFAMTHSLNGTGFFLPTIVRNLGFTGYRSQLMTVPPQLFGLIIIIVNAWSSDYRRERPRHIIAGLILVATGYLLLAVVRNWIGRFIGVFFICCTNAAVIPFLAYRTATVTGATSTAIATGGVIAIANCSGFTTPYLFPSSGGPLYLMGNWTLFALLMFSVGITLFLWYKLGSSSEYRTGTNSKETSEGVKAL